MLYITFNVIYVLVAIAMTAFILLQQGDGAAAGSGFGSGASGTVFGARGSANFLSKSTAVLATIFMLMAMGMAMYLHKSTGSASQADDLGIMGSLGTETAAPAAMESIQIGEIPQPTVTPAPVGVEEVPAPVEVPEPPAE